MNGISALRSSFRLEPCFSRLGSGLVCSNAVTIRRQGESASASDGRRLT